MTIDGTTEKSSYITLHLKKVSTINFHLVVDATIFKLGDNELEKHLAEVNQTAQVYVVACKSLKKRGVIRFPQKTVNFQERKTCHGNLLLNNECFENEDEETGGTCNRFSIVRWNDSDKEAGDKEEKQQAKFDFQERRT